MKQWSDSALTSVAHLSDRLGRAARMLDTIMDRVVTVQTAKACGGFNWYYCANLSYCIYGYACRESNQIRINTYVMSSSNNCYNPWATTCTLNSCQGC
jgi:hypothetical protein